MLVDARAPLAGSAEGVLFSVLAAAQDFAAPHAPGDDASLVVVRRQDA